MLDEVRLLGAQVGRVGKAYYYSGNVFSRNAPASSLVADAQSTKFMDKLRGNPQPATTTMEINSYTTTCLPLGAKFCLSLLLPRQSSDHRVQTLLHRVPVARSPR